MEFIKHPSLAGKHALFSASQSQWLRYSDDKLIAKRDEMTAQERGTKLHEWAKMSIDLCIKQPRSKKTLYAYVNDAIGFKMDTEVVLYYSDRFFGTDDAISFHRGMLRIHDLKTGKVGRIEKHIDQLIVYAALFCLEYKINPEDIKTELRIYKQDEVLVHDTEPDEIREVMERIIYIDNLLNDIE